VDSRIPETVESMSKEPPTEVTQSIPIIGCAHDTDVHVDPSLVT
jgi:hypothetical protein